jgi:hypothetical protein
MLFILLFVLLPLFLTVCKIISAANKLRKMKPTIAEYEQYRKYSKTREARLSNARRLQNII